MFDDLNALYRHEPIELNRPAPPVFVLHRFLASDPDYSQVWRYYARLIRDNHMCLQFWRAILPKQGKAPFLKYVAPKKLESPEALIRRYMEVFGLNRLEAEEAVEIIEMAGEKENLANYLGVELDA